MSVYFAQFPTGGIKIGHSNDVLARLDELEKHYGVPLSLLHTEPGSRPEEDAWHERFAHLRLGRTEQFRPGADLMAAIGRPLLVGANPDAIAAVRPAMKTILVRCSGEWAAWIEEFARKQRTDVSKLIDTALLELSRQDGFRKPPIRKP